MKAFGKGNTMTTDELISRARHALSTGQPNLAQLYMRNAMLQVETSRRKLNPIAWQARQIRAAFEGMVEAVASIGTAIGQLFESLTRAVEPTARKNDYALVADVAP